MPTIIVQPGNKAITADETVSLKDNLIKAGFNIKSPCGGCASCGQCVVTIESGEEVLSEVSFEEKQLLGNVFHITKERLSCQTYVTGTATVNISQHMQKAAPVKTTRRSSEDVKKIEEERKEARAEMKPREGGFRRPKAFRPKKDEE